MPIRYPSEDIRLEDGYMIPEQDNLGLEMKKKSVYRSSAAYRWYLKLRAMMESPKQGGRTSSPHRHRAG